MIITKAQDVQIGNLYMYLKYDGTLIIGECVGVSKTSITLKNLKHSYLGDDTVYFVKTSYPKVEYNKIADYDKRIFNAYNKRIEGYKKELEEIWNGKIKKKKSKKKGFRWFR